MENKLCRLCFTDDQPVFADLFSGASSHLRMRTIIVEHFKCQITEDGTFPTHVCTKCWFTTDNFHQFYQSVKQAEEQFLISKCKTESDPIDETIFVDPIQIDETKPLQKDKGESSSLGMRSPSPTYSMRSISPLNFSSSPSPSSSPIRSRRPHSPSPIKSDFPINIKNNSIGISEMKPFSINIANQIAGDSDEEIVYVDKIEVVKREGQENESSSSDEDDEIKNLDRNIYSESSSSDESLVSKDLDDSCSDDNEEKSDIPLLTGTSAASSQQTKKPKKKRKKPTEKRKDQKERAQARREAFDKLFSEHAHLFNLDCEQCSKKFKSLYDARDHYTEAHSNDRGYIRCCNVKLRYRNDVLAHLKVHINPDAYKCDECGLTYKSSYGYRLHKRAKHGSMANEEFVCEVCDKTLSSKSGLKKHVQDQHTDQQKMGDQKYKDFMLESFDMSCDMCDAKFQSYFEARTHYKDVHDEDKGYIKCCGRKLRQFSFVMDHINAHFNPALFKCDVCGKNSSTRARMQQHKKRHKSDHKPFICEHCGKGFLQKKNIQNHLLIQHRNLVPRFECELCAKRFQMEDQLTRHKYNVHREKKPKVTCEVCGKSFQSNAILNKHKVSHENDDEKLARSQQCEYCGEWLQSKSGIYYHEQIHTSGPQTCDQCGLVLANKIALQGHIRKTHRVAKFKCSYCNMAFTECSTLTKHEEQHTRHKTYPCRWCDKVFTLCTSRRTHQKRNHPVEVVELREQKKLARVPHNVGK